MAKTGMQGVLNAALDDTTTPASPQLRTTSVGSASAGSTAQTDDKFDINAIFNKVYDRTTRSIRVVTV